MHVGARCYNTDDIDDANLELDVAAMQVPPCTASAITLTCARTMRSAIDRLK